MKLNALTVTDIAKLGLYLDDPFGDGGRLTKVAKPNEGRLAALAEVRGEPVLGGEALIRAEYEATVRNPTNWTKKGLLVADIVRNLV